MQHLLLWLTVATQLIVILRKVSIQIDPTIIVPRKKKNNSKNSASCSDNGIDSVADSTNQWKFMSAYSACTICMHDITHWTGYYIIVLTVEIT